VRDSDVLSGLSRDRYSLNAMVLVSLILISSADSSSFIFLELSQYAILVYPAHARISQYAILGLLRFP